ncbi:MAG: hypothetical protein R2795_09030 [Saprospiraceae bacterium]
MDTGNEIEEYPITTAEFNNVLVQTSGQVGVPFFIVDNSVVPVWPPDFAIVGDQELTLKASTANMLADEMAYHIQIDTTPYFATVQDSKTIVQRGGVIRWQPNGLEGQHCLLLAYSTR